MANQNFRVKHGLEVGGVEIANSSGAVNASSLPASGVTAASYGNTTKIAKLTVNAKGLITAAEDVTPGGMVSDFDYTAANTTYTLVTGGGTYAQTIPVANSTVRGLVALANGISANATGYLNVLAGNSQVVSNTTGVWIAEGNIDIHNLSGYVANENIDHSSVNITAGNGLTGGGDISATRTVSVNANNGITVNSTGTFVRSGTGTTVNSTGVHIGQAVGTTSDVEFRDLTISGNLTVTGTQTTVNTTNMIVNDAIITLASGQTGTPSLDSGFEVERGSAANALFYWDESTDKWTHKLAGGTEYKFFTKAEDIALGTDTSGNYMTDTSAGNGMSVSHTPGEGSTATVTVNAQTGLTANSTGLYTNDGEIDIHSLSGYVANEHIDHSSVSVTAGNGLEGGGTIAATRTVAVLANTGITSNSTGVFTKDSEIDHDSLSNFVANEHIDHSSVTMTAGNGLTGGGTIAATRTLAVNPGTTSPFIANSTGLWLKANTGIVANSSGVFAGSGGIVHDDLSGFVANEHIDHSGVDITAGNGLTGGGDITATRTLAVEANTGIVANSDGVFVNAGQVDHDGLSNFVANEHIDHSTVSVTAGNGLSGGGTIAATRTLAVVGNTGITSNSTGVFTNDSEIDIHSLSGYVANEHIDHSSVTMTAGNGITGGGTIAATRTFAVEGNTGITVSSDGVFTNDSEIVHDSLSGFVSNEHIDHSSVSVTAGNGLSGGGDITTTRTITVKANNGISANSSGVFAKVGSSLVVNSTGIHTPQALSTTDNVQFNDLTVAGNLTVSGATVTIDATTLSVNDNIITLSSGHSGAPSADAGLSVNRGSSANAELYWDESTDRWTHKLAGGSEYAVHTKANDIALGTDTSGNYVDNVTAGVGLAVTGSAGEGWEPAVAVVANTGITANSTGIFTNDSEIDIHSLSGYVANEHIDHSGVTITAGNGLSGGGDITATRTLTLQANNGLVANSTGAFVVAGTGVTVNSTGVHIGQSVGTGDDVTFNNVDVDGDLRDGSNRVFKVYNSSGTVVWG